MPRSTIIILITTLTVLSSYLTHINPLKTNLNSFYPSKLSNCAFSDPNGCQVCKDGFFIKRSTTLKEKSCEACSPGCQVCSDSKTCNKCSKGFFPSETGISCLACSEYCEYCFEEDKCQKCTQLSSLLDGKCYYIKTGTLILLLVGFFATFGAVIFGIAFKFLLKKPEDVGKEDKEDVYRLADSEPGNEKVNPYQ